METVKLLIPWDYLSKNTGACCCFLLKGIFLTRGQTHWQADSLPLNYLRSSYFSLALLFFFPLELYFCWYDCRDKTLSPLSHQSVRKGICCSDIDVGTPVYSWLVFVWCNFFCILLSFFLYPYIGQVSLVSIIKKIQCVNVCLFLLEYSVYLHLI